MAIDTSLVGKTFGPYTMKYDMKSLELFALGCNCAYDGITGIEYVDEYLPEGLKVLPMFAAMPIVDSEVTNTIDYGADLAGSLHWGFDLRIHSNLNDLAKKSGTLSTEVKLEGLYDRGPGKGLIGIETGDTYDEEGNLICSMETWDCLIFDGGWGGEKPPKDIVEMPDRAPDYEVEETIAENMHLIHRLSGNMHPVHVDWEYSRKNGNYKPIAHALGYGAVAMRHIIDTFIPGEPERLTRYKARMCTPVLPGATVKTQIWKVGENEVRFALVDALCQSAKPYMNWGIVEWK